MTELYYLKRTHLIRKNALFFLRSHKKCFSAKQMIPSLKTPQNKILNKIKLKIRFLYFEELQWKKKLGFII